MLKRSPVRKLRTKPRRGRLKGKDMESLRREAFDRDGYRCQHVLVCAEMNFEELKPILCLRPITWETGHLAHIISRGAGGKDELSNVLTKCPFHHMVAEHSYGPSGIKPVPKKQT